MKVRFYLTNGQVIEIDPPADFNFSVFCLSIRASGFLMSSNIYIDHFKVLAITFGDSSAEIKPAGATLQ